VVRSQCSTGLHTACSNPGVPTPAPPPNPAVWVGATRAAVHVLPILYDTL
jgi:hypothetical protein